MARKEKLTVELGADVKDFQRGMKEASKGLQDMGKNMQNIGKSVGTSFSVAGLAITTGLGAAVKTAADFESSMSRVGALSGASNKELKTLTKTAKDLGATTSFSASQAAEGMSFLAMAGYKTNEIVAAMPGLLDTAAAGQLDLGTTADITSNILQGFGLQAEETGRVADVLTKAFTSSNVDLQMLGETMKYVAPTANSMKLSLEEVAAAAGILGNAGIQGSMAGSSLSMSLTRLASPSKEAAELMSELGFNAFDSKDKMLPLNEIIANLIKSTGKLTEKQKMHAISTIFGAESMKAMLTLMEAGPDALKDFTKELENSGGTAKEVAEKQLDNFNGQITILKSGMEAIAISMGDALLPALKIVTKYLQKAVDWFNNLSEPMKSTIAIGAALVAGFMFIVAGAGFLVAILGTLVTAQWAVLLPMFAIIAGIALLVAGFVWAYSQFEWFRDGVNTVFQFIWGVIQQVMSAIASFVSEKLTYIKDWWQQNGAMIMQAVQNVWSVISVIIELAMALIVMIIKGTWNAIKDIIGGVIDVILGIIKFFAALFTGNWSEMWEAVKQILKGALSAAWGLFQLTFGRILKYAGKILGSILKTVGGWVGKLLGWFKNLGTKAFEAIKGMWTNITSRFTSAITSVGRKIAQFKTDLGIRFLQIVDGIKSTFSRVLNIMTQPFKDAWSSIKSIISKIKSAFNNLKLKIPKPKIPKLDVSFSKKSFLGLDIPVPNFDLSWYKTGGMFNGPSVIGVGEQPGVKEVAMPLSGRHMEPFAEAVAKYLPKGGNGGGDYYFENVLVVDGQVVSRQTVKYDEQELQRMKRKRNRGKGQVFYD